ncbi:hypothetical protein AC579_996 [Pseudocercospora musae]|uniref:Uncharacterized protein n=1 Tax=Pseudocercospora musae TaxID=113226 RepID=A0A139HJ06_9PEZI|nr:hypothetical protein AC579_996 [Pseudocercospora musae]
MLKPYIYSLTARLHDACDTSWNPHSIPSAPIDLEPNISTMSTNKVLQSSVLSLQSDVPFFLGRKAASKSSTTSTSLDPIGVAQLKARAIAANKQKEALLAKAAQPPPAQSQYQTRSAPSPHWTRIPHGVNKRGSNKLGSAESEKVERYHDNVSEGSGRGRRSARVVQELRDKLGDGHVVYPSSIVCSPDKIVDPLSLLLSEAVSGYEVLSSSFRTPPSREVSESHEQGPRREIFKEITSSLIEQSAVYYICLLPRSNLFGLVGLCPLTNQSHQVSPSVNSIQKKLAKEPQHHQSTETIDNVLTQPVSNSMAPVRYRYVSSRDINDHSPDPIHTSSKQSAIEHYARLQNLVKRHQSQNILIQMLVIHRWRDHMERRKKLAWKVLMALRLRVLTKGLSEGKTMGWEEEGGQLCLVS